MNKMNKAINQEGIGLFAVELKETNGWLGFIGVNYITSDSKYKFDELPFYEIGWRLIPEVWGNGFATEGAEAVLQYAKQKGYLKYMHFQLKIIYHHVKLWKRLE